jgi:phosphate transport system permease protein
VYLAEFGDGPIGSAVRYATDLLNGVPSIVLGILVYFAVVLPTGHFSLIAGALALSVIFVPATVRPAEQFLRSVPSELREGALALGASQWKAITTVVIPAALPGIVTSVIIGFARVAGESAPLLFTTLGNQFWSPGWNHPTASLPVLVYVYSISPYRNWQQQAWAAAFVLILLVLALNTAARLVLSKAYVLRRNRI